MRYRLRTLFIVVTFIGLYLGWMAHALQQARFHRQAAREFAHTIADVEQYNSAEIKAAVQVFAAGRTMIRQMTIPGTGFHVTAIENGNMGRIVHEETASDWFRAIRHEMLAAKYERATFLPWILVGGEAGLHTVHSGKTRRR